MSFHWRCPFCQAHVAVTDNLHSTGRHPFRFDNDFCGVGLKSEAIRCPSPDCGKITVTCIVEKLTLSPHTGTWVSGAILNAWNLIPESTAIPVPEYVPKPISQDYEEACRISALSPKASATLSRRCLQGMIRDYWKVKPANLVEEIKAIETKVESSTWKAIDAVRQIGNIGAHMEADINTIVDVDPGEAEQLVRLIEMLIEDWYIARHDREKRVAEVLAVANAKQAQKNANK